MSFVIQSPNASPFSSDPPRPQRQQSNFRPPVAPSPGGYQQGSATPPSSEGYFPSQAGGQSNMNQQPPHGAPYNGTPQDIQGMTQQMSSMNVDARAGTPHTRRKKDRHAYHQFDAPGAGAQGSYGAGTSGQFVTENNTQTSVPGQEAPWQQGSQPWQSQKLPSQSSAAQTSHAPAGTPINLGGGGGQPHGAPPGAGGNKVNPALIPSIPASRDVPAEFYKTKVYPTMEQRIPPPASVAFVAYDQGNASPKHARLTLNCIPSTQEQLNTTAIPLGLIVQPLGKQTDGESAIPVLDFGEAGPPRCRRCRAYVNPFMTFSNGGNRMTCNLCGHPNEVAAEYFSPTDPSGVRVDRQDRPELLFGSCEFLVPKEYWSKEPVGLRYLFLLDVSAESCTRGFLRAMCDGLIAALYGDDVDDTRQEGDDNEAIPAATKVPAGAKVGFMTFDREVHSYNVNAALSAPQQLVMSDLEEPFATISPQHLFVDPAECKTNILSLLQRLPGMFEQIRHAEPALFPSLTAALSTLSESGGKIICSLSSLPTFGPGRLTVRDKGMQTATNDHPEQEKVLLRTENQSFRKLHADMIKAGVGVDFFLNAPSGGYLDIATIGLVAEKTGGDTYYYPNWTYPRDTLKLKNELSHAVQREQGYAALMKVRCSNGLQISHYSGNFTQHTFGADLEMGTFTEDTAIGITFSYDTKLDSRVDAYFQSALLYTTASGQRRVRCTNAVASITEQARECMRYVDQDAVLAVIAKEAAMRVPERSLHDTRQHVQDKATDILAAYRKHHSGGHPSTQLVMPENLKEFAMYILGLLKSRALKGGREPSDRRSHELRLLKGISPANLSLYLYPRITALHNLDPNEGFADENGYLKMPQGVRASFATIEEGGAYLVDNGQQCLLWMHQQVSPNLIEDLFGPSAASLESLDANLNTLPVLETLLNAQVRNILLAMESTRSSAISLQLARQGFDGAEYEFARLLYEDSNNDKPSYVDWLVLLHRGVSAELSGQGRNKGSSAGGTDVAGVVTGAMQRVTGGGALWG